MTIYTKIFIINWILLISVTVLDDEVFDSLLERNKNSFLSMWALLSVVATPIWMIYIVVIS